MHDHAAHERMQRLTGIALMCGAVMCFALLDTMAKYLNLHMSTLQVVWARYTGAFLFPFMFSNPWTRPRLLITARPVLQIAPACSSRCQPVPMCTDFSGLFARPRMIP
jgi:drug/metabolite transporter (DMT)-like permease